MLFQKASSNTLIYKNKYINNDFKRKKGVVIEIWGYCSSNKGVSQQSKEV